MISSLTSIFSTPVVACATCTGTALDGATMAANWAIIFMGGILFPILGGIILMILTLRKREAAALARAGGLPGQHPQPCEWNHGGSATR